MTPETVVFWLGVVGMLVGTAFVAYRWSGAATAATSTYYAVAGAATAVGAVAYLLSALGVGTVAGAGRAVPLARYAGWLVVAALLLAALWLLAGASVRLLAALVGLDVLTVALRAAGELVTTRLAGLSLRNTRLALWAASVVVLLVLIGVLLRVLSPQAGRRHRRNPDVAVLFSVLRNLLVVAWLLSPVVWLLSAPGLAVVGATVAIAGYLVLDLAATVGVAALLVRDDATLQQAEA
ncbi:MAG: bacteriorhodopsin [Haloarculaceae archaeon]